MSKPDPAGGSLESILASIRKSLSEQSTDALDQGAAASASAGKDAKPQRKNRLTQRLAGASAQVPAAGRDQVSDDLSDLLDDGLAGPVPAAPETVPGPAANAAEPSEAAPGEQDPLWFLTRREKPTAGENGLSPVGGAPDLESAGAKAPVAEPNLTRPEVVRASMPPFFGSSTDVAKSAPPPADPAVQGLSGAQQARQTSPSADSAAKSASETATAREVPLMAAAAEAAATRAPQLAAQSVPNGKAASTVEQQAAPSISGDAAYNRALEAMVLDLLKPMLSRWLDENMPRLVAEALEEEVRRTRATRGDAKKT